MRDTAWAVRSEDLVRLDPRLKPLTTVAAPATLQVENPAITTQKIEYLRQLIESHGYVGLAHLPGATERARVSLLQVYVPLKLGVTISIEVRGGQIADWWLHEPEERGRPVGVETSEEVRQRTFKSFSPDPEQLALLLVRISQHLSEDYSGVNAAAIEDGIYDWDRLESEVGPALMRNLVITGTPGSGKSTLIHHLALSMAGDILRALGEECEWNINQLAFWPYQAFIPVIVQLRALVSAVFPHMDDEITLQKFLDYIDNAQLKPNGLTELLPSLRDDLRSGAAMVFLDGLDEVPSGDDPKRRGQVKSLVQLLRTKFPKSRIVVTSRPYAYAGDWKLDGFGDIALASMDPDRLKQLAINLLRQRVGPDRAEEEAVQFMRQLDHAPLELQTSPLLFTLMVDLWLRHEERPPADRLPATKGGIYRECAEALLRMWEVKDVAKKQTILELTGLTGEEIRRVLEYLAFRVHSTGTGPTEFESGMIMTTVRALRITGANYDQLLDIFANRAGLIFESAPEIFQFAHRNLQEYFAACYLASEDNFPGDMIEIQRSDPGAWREVGALLAEEVTYRKRDLWPLIHRLLPEVSESLPSDREDRAWQRIAYAARVIRDYLLGHPLEPAYRPRLQRALAELVRLGALPPVERVEMGQLFGMIGDTRSGVGLVNGVPDIDWVEIEVNVADPDEPGELLPNRFRMSRFLTTFCQFQAFIDDPEGYANDEWWEGLAERASAPVEQQWKICNHPRERVNWYEAVAYCRWLSSKMGFEVRLPTTLEWEIAARGPNRLLYPYGNAFVDGFQNIGETAIGQTSAVGLFPDGASPYGVVDMSGNVWEWCLSGETNQGSDTNDPRGDAHRVVRGGSRSSTREDARTVAHHLRSPHSRNNDTGFRVVCGREMRLEMLLHVGRVDTDAPGTRRRFDQARSEHPDIRLAVGEILLRTEQRLTALACSSDGSRLAVGSSSSTIHLLATGPLKPRMREEMPRHRGVVRCLRFHPLRYAVGSVGEEGLVRLAFPRKREYQLIGRHDGPVYGIAFHPRGDVLATASKDGTIKVWSTAEVPILAYEDSGDFIPEPLTTYRHDHGTVFAADFDRTGNYLATAGTDGIVYLWDVSSGDVQRFEGFEGTVFSVRFDIRGNLIGASGEDGTVRLWRLSTGECQVLSGHTDMVRWLSFHPSGNLLVSAGKDQTVRLWGVESGERWVLEGHTDYVYSSEFGAGGSSIYSVAGDGTLREWPLPAAALTLLEE